MPTTLFHTSEGWFVSTQTRIGFQHNKVASAASARPTAEELTEKGYQI